MPTEWPLRPVSSAARDAAHTAVVWKVGEAQPLGCQPVKHRGIGWPTERAHVAVADVVAHDQQHIRRALRRPKRLGKRARRVLQGHLDPAPERRVRRRQHRSIRLVWRGWCAHDEAPFQARGANRPVRHNEHGQPKGTGRHGRGSGPGDPISSPRGLRPGSPPRGRSAKGWLRPVLPGGCPPSPLSEVPRCRADSSLHQHHTDPGEPASPAAGDVQSSCAAG
jgi:hypothetical protein